MKTSRRSNRNLFKKKSGPELLWNAMKIQYPNWKEHTKQILEQKGKAIPDWPKGVFAPFPLFLPLVFKGFPDKNDPKYPDKIAFTSMLTALIPWSFTKGIYRFSPEIFEELSDSKFPDKVPVEILKRLPQWSIYVELPEENEFAAFGFFTHLDFNGEAEEFKIVLVLKNHLPQLLSFRLETETFEESFGKMKEGIKGNLKYLNMTDGNEVKYSKLIESQYLEDFKKLLPFVLYLCSEDAEYKGSFSHENFRKRGSEKNPLDFQENSSAVVWYVGVEISKKLREYRNLEKSNDSKDGKMTPHIRRAHWHHYWVGNKEEPDLIVRWLSPIPVKMDIGKS
ncbi:AcrVA2 family anti-CRISPR protein (plasmid) [Leptospira sp. WS92.C1]